MSDVFRRPYQRSRHKLGPEGRAIVLGLLGSKTSI